MDQGKLTVPKHGGPDGQGLPVVIFDLLLELLPRMTSQQQQQAIDLCFSLSTCVEWNDIYRPRLKELMDNK